MTACGAVRLSTIATVRNEQQTIGHFVDSLLRQTHRPDEIIIVDGASTDGTREILAEYARRGDIKLISKECNIAQGRNLGIAAASGTHIAVTDAGCRVDANWLAEIIRCFEADPLPDIVAGNFQFETHSRFEAAVVRATFQPNRDNSETARYYPSSRSVAFTKAAWEKAGGYPEWLYAAEDTLFNIRLRQIGCRFAFCRAALVTWRPRETWRALARQRFNFARGNARAGIGTAGYLSNLQTHAITGLLLLAGAWFLPFIIVAFAVLGWHVHRHMWPQVVVSTPPGDLRMRLRVTLVMEFVRLVNLYGFLRGRLDRLLEPSYVARQMRYMGVGAVDDLDFLRTPGDYRRKRLDLPADLGSQIVMALAVASAASGVVAYLLAGNGRWTALLPALLVAASGTALLLMKSIAHFTQTGPRIRKEVLGNYRRHSVFALVRLWAWAFAIMLFTGGGGVLVYYMFVVCRNQPWSQPWAMLAAALGVLGATLLQFIRKLRFNPSLLVASMHYRVSRLYGLWNWMTPRLIYLTEAILALAVFILLIAASRQLLEQGRIADLVALWAAALFYCGTIICTGWLPDARAPRRSPGRSAGAPNILMIGSDTLRSDRLSMLGYQRMLTPHIERLAKRGVLFSNCYVPCARTAPSLVSLMTGTWPHTHGIRDNFVSDVDTRLNQKALPELLKSAGYRSAVISDWCGADMGKFSFGFDYTELPADQWNLKYLIRQGPKDLRLFVSLFTHNRLGRLLIPEIYYLGGVSLTEQIGRRARRLVSRLAERPEPFFLNVFFSTTHPPFASEWPWYTRFAERDYKGESKFAMARLTDPFEIIRRQGLPQEEFDLDQIINLYDGCVAEFDDEVGRMLNHLQACGLADNTIVAIYSDHGMEFFEHKTWGQGNSAVGDFSARIPLLIADPRRPRSMIVEEVTRSIDFAPTILSLLGIARPASMEGVSLAACWDDDPELEQLDAYNETGIWLTTMPGMPEDHLRYPDLLELLEVSDKTRGMLAIKPEYREIVVAAKDRMLRRGQWKLVYQPLTGGVKLLLFDLAKDPLCTIDFASVHPEIVDELWDILRRWIGSELCAVPSKPHSRPIYEKEH